MDQSIVEMYRQGFPASYIAAWMRIRETEVRQCLVRLGLVREPLMSWGGLRRFLRSAF